MAVETGTHIFVPFEEFEFYLRNSGTNKEMDVFSSLFASIADTFLQAFGSLKSYSIQKVETLSSLFSPKVDAMKRFYYINFSDKIQPIILEVTEAKA